MRVEDELKMKEIATPSNPPSGYVKVYPKSNGKLYRKNSAGNEVELGAGGGGGGINYTADRFTSSGTWTKPSGLIGTVFILISGGGGGGSGRRGAASSARAGGAGGGSSSFLMVYAPESALSATESITVGSGGNGGDAQTTNNTNGIAGNVGGNTFIRDTNFIRISGQSFGAGGASFGTTSNSQNNVIVINTSSDLKLIMRPNGNSRSGTSNVPANSLATSNRIGISSLSAPVLAFVGSASHGGGINASNTQGNAQDSHGYYDHTLTLINELAGAAPESATVTPNIPITLSYYWEDYFLLGVDVNDWDFAPSVPGGGGSCGNLAGTVAGGNGGNGIGPGGGGGGGGASTNGANSGAGGNGANGLVIAINLLS